MDESRICIVCQRRELEAQTCVRCVSRARRALIDVEQLYALLPAAITTGAGAARPLDLGRSHSDEDPLPGGDALVLLAGGSAHWHYGETGADSVLGILDRWEADWRVTLEIPAATDRATVGGCTVFLLRGLSYMAQKHPAFDEFARDIRQLRSQLQRVTRTDEPRDRPEIECPDCGGEIRSVYAKPDACPPGCTHEGEGHDQGGLRSWWVCRDRRCGRTVTGAEYWLTSRQRKQGRLDREVSQC